VFLAALVETPFATSAARRRRGVFHWRQRAARSRNRDLQPLEAVRRGETKRILRRSGLIEPIWAARHAAYVGGAAPGGYRVHSSES
jgi:hypothetical protein